jgi:hypothetical protein
MRPVESQRLMGRGQHRPTMFAFDQHDIIRRQAKVCAEQCPQRRPTMLTLIAESPHVNLVIVQVLCYFRWG